MITNMDFARCATCLEDYDDSSHRPCIGFCGHSLCLKCQIRIVSCPLCKRKNAFFGTVINYQLLDACLAIRQIVNEKKPETTPEKKSPNRSRSVNKRHCETPNISQQVVNATRRNRRTALETAVDKTQQREIENGWISQHIPAPDMRRRDRSNRRLSERMVFGDHIPPPCHYRAFYAVPPDNFAAVPSTFTRIFFGRSCFEI
ncbi:unnamed protein product [Caenorhabditis angaria]|uniref:RING-type domain-containing protein n=1 Tax=Caenorhabditis angaria TaxID=860376 RepID=A0A9P1J1G3_9PELO|nr:unnamed protein product [Caenorhabditis angaria]